MYTCRCAQRSQRDQHLSQGPKGLGKKGEHWRSKAELPVFQTFLRRPRAERRARAHTYTHSQHIFNPLPPPHRILFTCSREKTPNKQTPRNNDKAAFWCLELKTQKNVVCACVCVHSPFSFSSWSKHDSRNHSLNKKSERGRERRSAGGRDVTFLKSGPRASSHALLWLSSAGSQERSAAASAVTGRPLSAAWPLNPTRALISPRAPHPATPAPPPGTSSQPLRISPKLPPGGLAFLWESRKFWTNSNRPSSPSGGAEGSVTVGLRVTQPEVPDLSGAPTPGVKASSGHRGTRGCERNRDVHLV